MLLTLAAFFFILWLLGWMVHFGGGLIHILLIVALFVFIFNHVNERE